MKLMVKCSLNVDTSGTKELMIHNPSATLGNVRAAISINFRLPVYGFRMTHGSVDLSNEKMLLRDSGLKDGDVITVVSKRDREEEDETGEQQPRVEVQTTEVSTAPTTSGTPVAPATTAAMSGVEGAEPIVSNNNNNDNDEETEEEDEEDAMDEGPMELLSHLLETVPNLVEMRQQFLTNPAEIMRQVQENDPRLFELITANHQEFLELVNNEDLVTTLQQQQEMQSAFLDEEGVFEEDEEMEEAVSSLMAQYLLSGGGSDNSKATEDAGDSGQSETQRYLERVPTEEEEGKIEQLMQLGFTRDQCRVAFFKTKGSLERAANLLFEDPPQL